MFAPNLLQYCTENVLLLDRCGAQLQFLKSMTNEKSVPVVIEKLFSTSWAEITKGTPVDYCK